MIFFVHKKEKWFESTSYVERPSAFWASSVLLSIGPMQRAHLMEGSKMWLCCCSPPRRIPFSPRHRPTQKERALRPGPTCRSREELSLNWRTEVTFGTILPTAKTCPAHVGNAFANERELLYRIPRWPLGTEW